MKLAFFDDYKLGVVVGDKIVDVSSEVKGIKALGPQDVIRGVIEKWSAYKGKFAAAAKKGKGKPLAKVEAPAAAAETREHHLHGGELHGGRHAAGAGADQRFHEIAKLDHRRWRHHGAARHGGFGVRGRGGARRRHRQEGLPCQGRRRDEIRVRLHQLHRRLGARRGAADQRVLPDEVARHVRADRALYRHRRRDQERRQDAGPADQQRQADAELQHRRHGAQDPALHRMGDVDPHAVAGRHPGDRHEPPRPQPVHGRRQDRADREGLGTLHIKVKDQHKRTWARITRLQHKESGAPGVHTPQTGGKYTPAAK